MTYPEIVLEDLERSIQTALQTSNHAMPQTSRKSKIPFRPPVRRLRVPPIQNAQIYARPPVHCPLEPFIAPNNVKGSGIKPFNVPYKFRNRKVSRADIIKALIFMEGGSLEKELDSVGLDISASAFVQRRHQISSTLFDDILTAFNETAPPPKTFQGWRVLAVDGTAVNLSRDPKSKCFVRHAGAPDGYCQLHATPLYDVLNKQYVSCVIQPQPEQDEIGALDFMLYWYCLNLKEKILIVADRAFSSYDLFATMQEKGVDFLVRVKNQKGAMREVAKLPMQELDREIEFTITTENTKEAREKGYIWIQTRKDENREYSSKTRAGRWRHPSPYPMKLRIVRILLESGEYETLATSLPFSVTPEQIKELYHARWGIESAFLELKYSFGLDNQHGKNFEFACQETLASMIMANVCSRIIGEVVLNQREGNKYIYAVNRKHAVSLIKQFMRTPGADGNELMKKIAKYKVAIRPDRQDERKLRPKTFKEFVYRVAA